MTTRTRLLILAAALGAAACGSDSSSGGPAPAPAPSPQACTPPSAPTVTFAAQVHPILTTRCGACHGTAWGSADRATSYAAAKARVDTSSPDQSVLVQKGDGRTSHGGGDRLDPGEVTSLTTWIRECAQDN